MNEQLVASITKLVIEKLNEKKDRNHTDMKVRDAPAGSPGQAAKEREPKDLITFKPLVKTGQPQDHPRKQSVAKVENNRSIPAAGQTDKQHIKKDKQLEELKSKTPSRIGVGRAGNRPKTADWLRFRFDHAAAVDAVYGDVSKALLEDLGVFSVTTRVGDKNEYIRRPDLGRRLSDEAKQTIQERCEKSPAVQIVISNGLSANAVETNVEDVYLSLQQSLKNLNIHMGTTFYVDKGRVALMDEIGDILTPDVVVMLIGERPGLVSAESLSAYICYRPRKGTIEADRMVVSNIHKGGIPPVEAGAYIGTVVQKVLKYEASGVSLVKKEE